MKALGLGFHSVAVDASQESCTLIPLCRVMSASSEAQPSTAHFQPSVQLLSCVAIALENCMSSAAGTGDQ